MEWPKRARTVNWESGVLTLDGEKQFEIPELTAEIMEQLAAYTLVGFHVKGYPVTDELLAPFAGHKSMANFGVEDGALTDACFPIFSTMLKLRYRWGADGQPEIDPEQAAIVRRIFSRFLLGHSVRQITTDLMADGIKTATGKTVWHDSVVQKMLCNEKYIGDALLQKTYIADLFTREKRVNNGELPKYYVHDCHPAIIDRETFQKVQEEIARRSSLKKTSSKAKTQLGKYCGKYVLSELLVCGECGSPYRRVIWTQKGVKRVVWRCQNRLEHGRKICKQSPTLDEGNIHDAVISAMNELFRMQAAKDAVKAGIAAVLAGEEQTMSLPAVEFQIRNLQERQLELFQLIVSAGADCTDYDEELQQVNMAKTRLMAQKAELEKEQRGAAAFESRLAELDMALEQASGTLTDFDELTVRQLVSNIKVLDKDSLLICFKDGTEITQAMQRRQTA